MCSRLCALFIVLLVAPRSCGALSVLRASNEKASPSVSAGDVHGQVTKTLLKKCGSVCAEVWSSAVALERSEHHSTNGLFSPLLALAEMAQQQLRLATTVKQENSNLAAFTTSHQEMADSTRSNLASSTDTACSSPANCKLKTLTANRCNFGREALQNTYQTLNVVAHTMGSAIAVLCGCFFVNDQATCALQSVPPVCIFPVCPEILSVGNHRVAIYLYFALETVQCLLPIVCGVNSSMGGRESSNTNLHGAWRCSHFFMSGTNRKLIQDINTAKQQTI